MRRHLWLSPLLLALIIADRSQGADPPVSLEGATPSGWLQRWHPTGGWNPYGGGLLYWWPSACFPCNCGPDDYHRKPPPQVCWPAYPPYYTTAPSPSLRPPFDHPAAGTPQR